MMLYIRDNQWSQLQMIVYSKLQTLAIEAISAGDLDRAEEILADLREVTKDNVAK